MLEATKDRKVLSPERTCGNHHPRHSQQFDEGAHREKLYLPDVVESKPLLTRPLPTLREGFDVGANTAVEMLIIFGDNPDRIRSKAAFEPYRVSQRADYVIPVSTAGASCLR